MNTETFTKDIRLEGKIALITGGAGGLGCAMAEALAGAGASVVLADINGSAAENAAKGLREKFNGRVTWVECDITKSVDCKRAVDHAQQKFGALHILVNNAGKGPANIERAPDTTGFKFWEADPSAWQDIIITNVNGTFLMTRAAVPQMIHSGWGRIVNISTAVAVMQRPESSPYGVSKAAIESETMIWAQDLAGTGVTVNSLQPGGAVDTAFFHDGGRKALAAQGHKPLAAQVLASPIVWLASPHSDGVTGARFTARLWDDMLPVHLAAEKAREAPVLSASPR